MPETMTRPNDFFEIYKKSTYEKDVFMMLELYDENVVIYDMWDKYVIQGKNNLKIMIREWFDSLKTEKVVVDFSNVEIKIDENLAFAHAFIFYKALSCQEEILRQMKNRITVCFIKKEECWKVIHQHTSIPISSKDISGIFE